MYGWGYGYTGLWWIFPVFMFLMMAACLFLMRGGFCMRGRRHPGGNARRLSEDSAEEILKKRYALGEIDQKEYEEKKSRLFSS